MARVIPVTFIDDKEREKLGEEETNNCKYYADNIVMSSLTNFLTFFFNTNVLPTGIINTMQAKCVQERDTNFCLGIRSCHKSS